MTGGGENRSEAGLPKADAAAPAPAYRRPWRAGLSGKLLFLTLVFVMISEILIYVPSIANFRMTWLRDAHATASVAAVVLAEGTEVPKALQGRLLASTDTIAIALLTGERRRLLAVDMPPETVDVHVDLSQFNVTKAIMEAFAVLLEPAPRTIRVTGDAPGSDERVEIVINDSRLRAAMLVYSRNIMVLSLIISIISAVLVYTSLRWLLVRPMQRLSRAIAHFADNPEDASRIIVPSDRADEIGDAERQPRHHAAPAVGDHPSEAAPGRSWSRRLEDQPRPAQPACLRAAVLRPSRLQPGPDRAADRAENRRAPSTGRVDYTRSVMSYGRAREAPPARRLLHLRQLADDVGEVLGLAQHREIIFDNLVDSGVEIDADPDQLFRVLVNLARNAVQVMESDGDAALVKRLEISAYREGSVVTIRVADTGPGVPARVREHLFQPFQASTRKGGTGLGLAIAAELVRAHGGAIRLAETTPGTVFEITLPDRPVDLAAIRRAAGR